MSAVHAVLCMLHSNDNTNNSSTTVPSKNLKILPDVKCCSGVCIYMFNQRNRERLFSFVSYFSFIILCIYFAREEGRIHLFLFLR